MASTRELRRRIKSVRSTRQITKAMELVATSKMRRASESTVKGRPFAQKLWEVLAALPSGGDPTHPLVKQRPITRTLAVVIASDRGLAGVYNAAVLKQTLIFIRDEQAKNREVELITIGRKLEPALLKVGVNLLQTYPQTSTHPTTADLLPLVQFIKQSFLQGHHDQVILIYTEFVSMLRQEVTILPLLPLQPPQPSVALHEFLYEPNPSQVLDHILPRIVEVELYQGLLESLASEHSARRLAMKNATDNASEMIDDLTLTYNGVRQSAITQELAEITSGAAALSN